jgi:hypothetical protein
MRGEQKVPESTIPEHKNARELQIVVERASDEWRGMSERCAGGARMKGPPCARHAWRGSSYFKGYSSFFHLSFSSGVYV